MQKRCSKLPTPSNFRFPHQPYEIQQQFMRRVYAVLEDGQIGIFESPTGTGKSLTLTCAALRWLEDHEEMQRKDLMAGIAAAEAEMQRLQMLANKEPDWISLQYKSNQQRTKLLQLREMQQLLEEYESKLQQMRHSLQQQNKTKQRQPLTATTTNASPFTSTDTVDSFAPLEQEGNSDDDSSDSVHQSNVEKRHQPVQIFFCSRTHSQLSQVLREIKRTEYGQRVRCLNLASRKHLCVHPEVKQLNSAALNERCLDMARNQKKCEKSASLECKSSKSTAKCVYKKTSAVQQLAETAAVSMLDIEELAKAGVAANACPYYAVREAINYAQLVFLPYQMLLHARTRQQSGVDLQNAVIVIDEAHNLLDTISQLHSSQISLAELQAVQQQLGAYKTRYSSRFNYANLLQINQLLFVVKQLVKTLQSMSTEDTLVLRTYELTAQANFDNIDIFKLLQFADHMRLAQKLQGFIQHHGVENSNEQQQKENNRPQLSDTKQLLQKLQQQQQHQQQRSKKVEKVVGAETAATAVNQTSPVETLQHVGAIRQLLSFLETLTDDAKDGRVLLLSNPTNASYKYILLNPGSRFHEIVQQARAIIIAGGTMQPTAELTTQLFANCTERVQLHFFDHVVPKDAVLPFVITHGATARQLWFNYAQRGSNEMLCELSLILENICSAVPAGLVCFVPSYDYLQQIYMHLEKNNNNIMTRIQQYKRIFCESANRNVEKLLAEYTAHIKSGAGALLFSVVGGKLSEGLNFADDLARGVIVVGLPYGNSKSPELQERMRYISTTLGPTAGNEYYENLCVKSVNQCIGRAVRHINDYATVFLLDARYANDHIKKKLPQWILRHLQCSGNLDDAIVRTKQFFVKRNNKKEQRVGERMN